MSPFSIRRLALGFAAAAGIAAVASGTPPTLASAGARLDCGEHLTYRAQATLGGGQAAAGADSPLAALAQWVALLGPDAHTEAAAVTERAGGEASVRFSLDGLPGRAHTVRHAHGWVVHDVAVCVADPAAAVPLDGAGR